MRRRNPAAHLLERVPALRGFLVIGLALYLWPALAAPVVEWIDSQQDLEWARRGVGILEPAPSRLSPDDPVRPVKPLYLLFLRVASALPALSDGRAIVLAQSILLWASIAVFALWVARRFTEEIALAVFLLLLLFLRTRDAASAVMSEALASALFLGVLAPLLVPPRRAGALALLGCGIGILFWVRPNVGAVAVLLAAARFVWEKRLRGLLFLGAGFLAVFVPIAIASRPASGEPTRGLAYTIWEGSADYFWVHALGPHPQAEDLGRAELATAAANWRRTLSAGGADARRQLFWRALHGFFGVDYYDARWSTSYWWLTTASGLLSPFLILISIAILLVAPFQPERAWNLVGILLIVCVTAQNFLLGSSPRYALPLLPVLLALGALGLSALARAPRWKRWTALGLSLLFCWTLAQNRGALAREWGSVEKAGVTLFQTIPAGVLPFGAPATLHVRIAPPTLPSNAHLEVFGPGSYRLYSSREEKSRNRPDLTIPLPAWLLAMNRYHPLELSFVSSGDYAPHDLLLFPIVPPPWGFAAVRRGESRLSPATGIAWGSLDWWAYSGTDE